MSKEKLISFPGRLLIVGFGTIGQGVLPLILKHIDIPRERVSIITAEDHGKNIAQEYGIHFERIPITKENYLPLLKDRLQKGDFLLNLSVNVSSKDLVAYCQQIGALYLDTCIEPWEGVYEDPMLSVTERSNYTLREEVLKLRNTYPKGPTSLLAHGANPGLVSHFVKQSLINIAFDQFGGIEIPHSREEWARLAQKLGIKVIHIAERDTQSSSKTKIRGEFVNTWSVDAFISEGLQPAELGWGTHEQYLPFDGHQHGHGCGAAIYLSRPGGSVRVRSWTPDEGPYHGFLIAHNEAISLADYLTVKENDRAVYRPTVHYAYHPCDYAIVSLHEIAGKNWVTPLKKRVMMNEIDGGTDELGVLLMGHRKSAYWYGSKLSVEKARSLAPHNNATSLQVSSSVLAGMVWVMEHPMQGIIEAEDLDYDRIIEIATPYLGIVKGSYSNWNPMVERQRLFKEEVIPSDPWQFKNFVVV